MKKLSHFKVKNKRVLVRVDFNVTLDEDRIADDFRIKAALPTIKYLLDQEAKVILLSHLGRPEGQVKEELRLDLIGQRLSDLLKKPIKKLNDCIGSEVQAQVEKMNSGEIILLENVQFHPGEKEKDPQYIQALAQLADIFVLDAFGQCHRDYASISGLPGVLPSCPGLLLEEEIRVMNNVLNNPLRPLVAIIGGAKISTKIKLIKNFLKTADDVCLGGALANTVIQAKGLAIGKSLTEQDMITEVQKLELTDTKLHIPVDVVVAQEINEKTESTISPVGNTKANESILDIGPDTIHLYSRIISQAKTVIWNGPMGWFELEKFSVGTKQIASIIAQGDGFSVVGGGETMTYMSQLGLRDKFNHVSSGGGAMLSFLGGEKLPGLAALNFYDLEN